MTAPGRPVGPYQGVTGMSGVNTSDTDTGEPLQEDTYFLDGTAGPAVEPQQT